MSVADDELLEAMLDEDEKSTADEEVYNEVRDPEWCEDAAEDMVEEDSAEPNSRRDVR